MHSTCVCVCVLKPLCVGTLQLRAKFSEDGVWYDATIQALEEDKFWVVYDEFGNTECLSLGQLELKNPPRGCPGNPLDPPLGDDLLWCVFERDCGVLREPVACGCWS